MIASALQDVQVVLQADSAETMIHLIPMEVQDVAMSTPQTLSAAQEEETPPRHPTMDHLIVKAV